MGLLVLPALALLTLASAWAVSLSPFWLFALIPSALLLALGVYDVLQRRRSILRNFPVLGHMRFLMEYIRPEIQQYFIETNTGGHPYDRDTRSVIYERAKGIHGDQAFGTELEVEASGYEFLEHSMSPLQPVPEQPRVLVGGPDCKQPYEMALLNVSAMSFGALSAHAILALNKGAKAGGFAHDTGEGGISPYHREGGGDLERAEVRLRGIEDSWAARGYGLCVVESLATGEAIGRSGLNWWDQFGETEVGWTFAREHWGRGYATEAARAVLDWGFGDLELTRVTAMIHAGNRGSIAVAERLGFTPRREDELLGKRCTVWALDRPGSGSQASPTPAPSR